MAAAACNHTLTLTLTLALTLALTGTWFGPSKTFKILLTLALTGTLTLRSKRTPSLQLRPGQSITTS